MQGQPPAAAGDAKTSPLQDKKVQIGLGVGALVIVIGAVVGVLMMNKPTETAPPPPPAGATAQSPGTMAPSAPGGTGGTTMPAMGGPTMGAAPGAAPGAGLGAGTAPGAGAATGENKPTGPAVASRKNAFAPNRELKEVISSIPSPPNAPTEYASAHDLFLELNPPKPDVEVAEQGPDTGPPIPPMRVTGIVLGNVVSAVIQLGDGNAAQFINVVPGKMIPEGNPVYRVASIENGTVTLVRRWEEGNRKGVQRIEVTLAGSSSGGGLSGGSPVVDFN